MPASFFTFGREGGTRGFAGPNNMADELASDPDVKGIKKGANVHRWLKEAIEDGVCSYARGRGAAPKGAFCTLMNGRFKLQLRRYGV